MDALLVYNYVSGGGFEVQSGGSVDSTATNGSLSTVSTGSTSSSIMSKVISFVSLVLFVYAIHLSYKRNNGFHAGSMLAAYCCTTMYLIWAFFNPIKEKDAEKASQSK